MSKYRGAFIDSFRKSLKEFEKNEKRNAKNIENTGGVKVPKFSIINSEDKK